MQYQETRPPPPLDAYVRCFWTLRDEAADAQRPRERIVPDGCVEMVFHLGDPFRRLAPGGAEETQRASLFAGALRASLLVQPSSRVHVFGIRFHPWGARPWLAAPLGETTDVLPSLEDAVGEPAPELEYAIRSARDDAERVAAAARWLLRRARPCEAAPRALVGAARLVTASAGRLPVAEVADRCGVGTRRLERLFREHVGLPPKTLSRIARLQAVLRRLRGGPPAPFARVALDAGYADQAHLTREFQDLVGLTPTAYAVESHALADWFGDAS